MPKHWRRNRPPLLTAELRAFNFGRRARAAGLELAALTTSQMAWAVVTYGPDDELAESRLGPELFRRWAIRGWIESRPATDANP